MERQSGTNDALGLSHSFRYRRNVSNGISGKSAKTHSSKVIRWRLSAISNLQLGFHKAILMEYQARPAQYHVRSQLSFARIFLQAHSGLSRLCCFSCLPRLPSNYPNTNCSDSNGSPFGPFEGCVPLYRAVAGCGCMIAACVWLLITRDRSILVCIGGFVALMLGGTIIWLGKKTACDDAQDNVSHKRFHAQKSVTRKYLTAFNSCNTVIDTANVLPIDKQIAVIGARAEGSSIRSIERLTGIHRDTIMRLGVKVGQGCEVLLDSHPIKSAQDAVKAAIVQELKDLGTADKE